ncbi:phosphotriesterase-related protein-like isoform X2 [Gigantopelta aegis]|nr:phosphotriesterase-related protein-like isoform X2 [Gigantopelta aegis]
MSTRRDGLIQTVTGLIRPDQLGMTLPHEHLWIDTAHFYQDPKPQHKHKINDPISLSNYGWVQQNPYSCKDNLSLMEESTSEAIQKEMEFFKQNGGCSIVENTTTGIAPNYKFLQELSKTVGVNIIAGTGYYVNDFQTDATKQLSVEAMSEKIRRDVTEGFDGTGIKCGVIGEVGCQWPLTDFERKSLQASAAVQMELGCPVIIHPGRHPDAPFEIVQVFQEAGGDVSKTVMSHLDRTIFDNKVLLEFAALGCYCEYDLFGIETSHYQIIASVDMPSDAQRIHKIKLLIDEGYLDKITISHDIHTKHRLMKYGGHGYSHILENIMPKMLTRGISKETVHQITVNNPKNWLTYKK